VGAARPFLTVDRCDFARHTAMSAFANPLISVYVANHNYGRYISQAIESVIGQTLQDFELLVIDDGSTDDSRAVIERYRGHPRVTPIFQNNQGLSVTNNIALRASRGKYIMRLDADDWLDAHALEVLAGTLERNPDVGMVFPDYYHVDEKGGVIEIVRRHDFKDVTLYDQPAHGACTLIRRDCLLELEGYDEGFRCQDGYELWVRFIERYKVKNINLPLFYYRQHGASLTRNEKRILDTRNQILARQAKLNGGHLKMAAIVPVRGPSFETNSLALEPLGGRALIDWSIEAALRAERVDTVVVTSPDAAVLDHIAARYGSAVLTHKRDPGLALPNTGIEPTILSVLEFLSAAGHPEPLALADLSIESPFRSSRHIDTAGNVLELFDTDSVIAVRPETNQFYSHDGTGLKPVRQSSTLRLERNELFREAGGLRVCRTAFLREQSRISGGRLGHVVLDQRAAINIRSKLDWEIAEALVSTEEGSHGSA